LPASIRLGMATSPIDPNSSRQREQREPLHTHDPKLAQQPESKFPWPLVAILIAALLLAAIIAYMPRTPKAVERPKAGGEIPPQPFVSEIHLTGLGLADSPVGGQTYVTGQMENTGEHDITGITVQATFHDQNNAVVQQYTRPLEELNTKNDANTSQPFTNSPLRAGQTRAFRVAFDNVPSAWNHQPPDLVIVHEAYVGGPTPTPAEAGEVGNSASPGVGNVPGGSKAKKPAGKSK
jgi:hypothetical protein